MRVRLPFVREAFRLAPLTFGYCFPLRLLEKVEVEALTEGGALLFLDGSLNCLDLIFINEVQGRLPLFDLMFWPQP